MRGAVCEAHLSSHLNARSASGSHASRSSRSSCHQHHARSEAPHTTARASHGKYAIASRTSSACRMHACALCPRNRQRSSTAAVVAEDEAAVAATEPRPVVALEEHGTMQLSGRVVSSPSEEELRPLSRPLMQPMLVRVLACVPCDEAPGTGKEEELEEEEDAEEDAEEEVMPHFLASRLVRLRKRGGGSNDNSTASRK